MQAYFEKLKTETNWLKLFIPIFVGMTILLEVLTPIIMYIIQVRVKNNDYNGHHFGLALCVSFIYSAVMAGVIGYRHKKLQEEEANEIG